MYCAVLDCILQNQSVWKELMCGFLYKYCVGFSSWSHCSSKWFLIGQNDLNNVYLHSSFCTVLFSLIYGHSQLSIPKVHVLLFMCCCHLQILALVQGSLYTTSSWGYCFGILSIVTLALSLKKKKSNYFPIKFIKLQWGKMSCLWIPGRQK